VELVPFPILILSPDRRYGKNSLRRLGSGGRVGIPFDFAQGRLSTASLRMTEGEGWLYGADALIFHVIGRVTSTLVDFTFVPGDGRVE
jgi:hypothetical protein